MLILIVPTCFGADRPQSYALSSMTLQPDRRLGQHRRRYDDTPRGLGICVRCEIDSPKLHDDNVCAVVAVRRPE